MSQMHVTPTNPKPVMAYLQTDLGQYRFVATIQKVCAFLALSLKERGSQYATIFSEQSSQFKTAVAVLAVPGCITSLEEVYKAGVEYRKPDIDVDSRLLYKLIDKIVTAVAMVGFAISLVFERALGLACRFDTVHNLFALGMAVEDITCAVQWEQAEVRQDEVNQDAVCFTKRLSMLKAAKALSSLLPVAIAATTVYTGVTLSPMFLAVNGVFGAFMAAGGDLYGNRMEDKADFHYSQVSTQLISAS